MKNNLRPRVTTSGFTLVELLVVIAIIAILASVITVAASGAINSAKRAKAANMGTQIQTAILAYNTEYGVYPVPIGTATDVVYSTGPTELPLFIALCGNINAYTATAQTGTVANTRNIPYLTPKRSEVDKTGVVFNQFDAVTDNQYYYIAMDADYSGILGDNGGTAAAPPDFSLTSGWTPGTTKPVTQAVAVWACCDPKYATNPASSTSPNLWVHTN